ncbi:glycolate oxidase subunit GlcE [Xanthobacter aminoxidans]|uniref:glycolate oxidase subunit GlcE n=1 Tax=Xanthobacter aminoxidans TaxID=186280 RepID=UPI002022BBEB|nr:glycolate oxidase subunit GlcE [Xanthobacter aminoxidans]MCL8381560.1 glycolate oxidase subunit GlcE [Xanthobacter aminoxidans]
MSDIIAARDEQEVAEAARTALGAGKTLEVRGHGSQQALGRPSQTDLTLDLSALSGVTLYEPEELVLSARAGTPRADIEEMVAARGQMLAFEPMDTGPLLGGTAGRGTIGGMFAVNLAGPRRISHGAVRDHALGIKAVSGRGEPFKSGGRVVKNVTGYDLPRLMAGAFGTLCIATEITLKVLPRPLMEETVIARVASPAEAAAALSAAMGSSCEVSGAAFLPEGVAGRLPGLSGSPALVALRMEGVPPSVSARRAMLLKVLAGIGRAEVLETETSRPLWQAVRDVIPFAGAGERAVWRLSTQPKAGPELAATLAADLGGEAYCDWAGGLIWLCLPGEASHADDVRAALAPFGGHATLIRASAAERARTAVFQPLDGALAALTKRVKESFDPGLVLNPGRMHAGM